MKKLFLVCILLLYITSVSALAESRLRTNVITNLVREDVLDSQGGSKITSVVVGYDAAVSDYLVGSRLAVSLTSLSKEKSIVNLSCDSNDSAMTVYVYPSKKVFLKTNLDMQTHPRILIGGPFVNDEVKQYAEVKELLKEPGDMLIKKYGENIVIAGFSGHDTERAASYFIDMLESS